MTLAKNGPTVETRLRGVPLSPGVAIGRPCYLTLQTTGLHAGTPTILREETRRMRDALKSLARQRSILAGETASKLGPEHAGIFEAHRLILADDALQARLLRTMEEQGCSARDAVRQVLDSYSEQLSTAESAYLQQRAADIKEIQQALLARLDRTVTRRHCQDAVNCTTEHCDLGNDHILVAREISASLPVETDCHTIGFIVEKAGPNSHAVILARALRCPVVGNIRDLPDAIPAQARVLVDGGSGEVIINPTAKTLARYQSVRTSDKPRLQGSKPVAGLRVMANISQSEDVGDALAAGAEGVGLYRTEMELLVAGRLLSEDEQAARYTEVVKAMSGKPVCIRLLDLGSDKTAGWLDTVLQDANVAGQRGARLLLTRPELLRAQARALARASVHGPVHVLYPMIVNVEQFLSLRAAFDDAVADLPAAQLQHGVLFEVPAACLAGGRIMQAADFGCIGTNDLIQYLFAEDRTGGYSGAHSRFDTDSVLWELIAELSRAAARAGKPMAICGEVAGNPELTCKIMDSGITAISTSPAQVASVRRAARKKGLETPPSSS